MTLNVTRHKLSENRNEIDNWMKTTGRYIQKKMVEAMLNFVEEASLSFDIDEVIEDLESTDYFSESAIKELIDIFKEKHYL